MLKFSQMFGFGSQWYGWYLKLCDEVVKRMRIKEVFASGFWSILIFRRQGDEKEFVNEIKREWLMKQEESILLGLCIKKEKVMKLID